MGPSVTLQSWALIRRYLITLTRSPISSFLRCIFWPCLVLGILTYMFVNADSPEYLSQLQPEHFIYYIMMILTVFDIWSFSEYLIGDRSTGMKSLMSMMGLKNISYYVGNSISFNIFVIPFILGMAILSVLYVFVESQTNTFTILLIFILYSIQMTGLTFVFASIITSSAYSSLVFIILLAQLIGLHKLTIWTLTKTAESLWPVVLFFAGISPFESFNIFCNSYTSCKHNCSVGMSEEHNLIYQPIYLTLLTMTFWSIIFYMFSRWFEEVCPWQTDTARKDLLFCCYSQKSSNTRQNEQLLTEDHPDSHKNSQYFEQITTQTRDVGIKIRNVSKMFNLTKAVSDLSFDIYQGETTLLLGHNGAGKTTLMNIILSKLTPNKGYVFINHAESTGTGVCPQTSVYDDNLNIRQHLELFVDLKTSSMGKNERESHILKTIQDVNLTDQSTKLPSELSGGMKRKLSLAMAFVGKSKVLILDEPSSGLDPDSRVFVWNAIRRYRKERTVLLSTQHMEEADYLGDRIAIMAEGEIICCGSSIFLNNVLGNSYKLRVECDNHKEEEVLHFVRRYFTSAKLLNCSLCPEAVKELTIELKEDKKFDDLELKLIEMLDFVENNPKDLHNISSYGLKSSSIEDVMLNTDKIFSDKSRSKNKSVNETRLNLSSTSERIETLSKAMRLPQQGYWKDQISILGALLIKQIQTYKTDWVSLLIYRVGIPLVAIYTICLDFKSKNMKSVDGSTSLEPILVMHLIYYPSIERISKFKTMQLTSYANSSVYWASLIITDLLTIILFTILYNILFIIQFDGIYVYSQALVMTILTSSMILFGISTALVAYILSNVFTDIKTCTGYFVMIFLSNTFVSYIIKFLQITLKKDLSSLDNIIGKIFLTVLPTSAMPYVRFGLISECYITRTTPSTEPICTSFNEVDPVIVGMAILILQIIAYSSILSLIEYINFDLAWYLRWKNIINLYKKPNSSVAQSVDVDVDVANESSKASQLTRNEARKDGTSLVAANLSKCYVHDAKVIDHLSFTVNKGECFGLLGVNGAGKSTTFAMLSAELKPDHGKIWINNSYDSSIYRHSLGYDPQSNPETSLTCIEALYLMARLRRINEIGIPILVKSVLELLQMEEHARKTASQLSGGTKRKLALGMSLIGNPNIALLDEPTAGVDPIARVDVWALLRSLRKQNNISIIISSHAMEECEAVCDRIAIMARGRLRCIGTFLHLRSKFSRGCRLKVQFAKLNGVENSETQNNLIIKDLERCLIQRFGNIIELADTNLNSATFNLNDNGVKRSVLLKIMREFRKKNSNLSYVLNDKSLEDIFITIAREEMERRET